VPLLNKNTLLVFKDNNDDVILSKWSTENIFDFMYPMLLKSSDTKESYLKIGFILQDDDSNIIELFNKINDIYKIEYHLRSCAKGDDSIIISVGDVQCIQILPEIEYDVSNDETKYKPIKYSIYFSYKYTNYIPIRKG